MHARAQIRDRVVALLTNLETTQERVYSGRTKPLDANHPPVLLIYAIEETSDMDAMGEPAGTLGRTLTLAIEGRATQTGATAAADLEALLDQIALEVEQKMSIDFSLGGLTREVTLISTRLTAEAPGATHTGEIRLEYRVGYRTRENTPGTAIL